MLIDAKLFSFLFHEPNQNFPCSLQNKLVLWIVLRFSNYAIFKGFLLHNCSFCGAFFKCKAEFILRVVTKHDIHKHEFVDSNDTSLGHEAFSFAHLPGSLSDEPISNCTLNSTHSSCLSNCVIHRTNVETVALKSELILIEIKELRGTSSDAEALDELFPDIHILSIADFVF